MFRKCLIFSVVVERQKLEQRSGSPDVGIASVHLRKYTEKPCKFSVDYITLCETWPLGYKTFFVLNSAEHEIYPAHKY